MQEIITQFFSYLLGAWRYRWIALATAWLVALPVWFWVWQQPESYVASARIYVDTSNVLRPLLRGLAIQPDINQRVSLLSRTLLSRPNLEKLMRMTDLDLEVNTEAEQEAMLTDLREAIVLSGDRRDTSLYSIEASHDDRQTARKIVQSLITVFIESSISNKRDSSSGAQDFLDQQIADYEQRLVAAEGRLAQFKQANVDVLPGAGGDYYSRLQAARAAVSQAHLELNELSSRKLELERQLDGEDPIFLSSDVDGVGSGTPLDARIESLRTALDNLLSRYTEKHPEAQQMRRMIRDLEAEKAAKYGSHGGTDALAYADLASSPVYQSLRGLLSQTNASIAEMEVRVGEYERRAQELDAKVSTIPEVEAKLKQLDRDYGVIQAQHQEMLERREAARLSEDVEQSANSVSFRVIDPPFVPLKPSEPDKVLLNLMGLALALVIGAGVALMLSLVFPVITDTRRLAHISGMPLLGVVPLYQQPDEKRRELYGLLAFSSLTAGLLVVFVSLTVVQAIALA